MRRPLFKELTSSCSKSKAPPMIEFLKIEKVTDSEVTLKWHIAPIDEAFDYEIMIMRSFENEERHIHLRDHHNSVILRDLKSNSNYTASVSTHNSCGHSNETISQFTTLQTTLHPAVTNALPQEIILIISIIILWLLILRHFFFIYSRVTFVTPFVSSSYKASKAGSSSSAQRFTENTNHLIESYRERRRNGFSSSKQRHSLLKNAVNKWRSDTILSKVELINDSDTFHQHLDRLSLRSDTADFNTKPRNSSLPVPTSLNIAKKRCIELNASNFELQNSSVIPASSVNRQMEQENDWNSANFDDDELSFIVPEKRCSIDNTAKNLGKSPIETDTTYRKLSEVLLGKATRDIRRYSCSNSVVTRHQGTYQWLRRFSKANSIKKFNRQRRNKSLAISVLPDNTSRLNKIKRFMSLPVSSAQQKNCENNLRSNSSRSFKEG